MSHVFSTTTAVARVLLLVSIAALVPKVAAHGYVYGVGIEGQWYTGFQESTWLNKASGSPILITNYLLPTYDVWSINITCGINPQGAQSIATVTPGNTISWRWVTHDNAPWTHNEGTHRSFIAPCVTDCGSVNPADLEWTELPAQYTGQQGYDGSTWPVLALANNQPWDDTVPPAPNGDYLIRNELTALHYSTQPYQPPDDSIGHGWGIELYPTCMAIRIQGSDGSFDMSKAVKFPGAYTVDEPGHYNPNLWTDPNSVGIAALNTFTRSQGANGNSNSNSGSNNGNSGSGSGGNNGGSSDGSTSPSSSSSATTPTVSNPLCNRRRKRSVVGRRHHQARRHSHSGAH